jgi:hypothetical protein
MLLRDKINNNIFTKYGEPTLITLLEHEQFNSDDNYLIHIQMSDYVLLYIKLDGYEKLFKFSEFDVNDFNSEPEKYMEKIFNNSEEIRL